MCICIDIYIYILFIGVSKWMDYLLTGGLVDMEKCLGSILPCEQTQNHVLASTALQLRRPTRFPPESIYHLGAKKHLKPKNDLFLKTKRLSLAFKIKIYLDTYINIYVYTYM